MTLWTDNALCKSPRRAHTPARVYKCALVKIVSGVKIPAPAVSARLLQASPLSARLCTVPAVQAGFPVSPRAPQGGASLSCVPRPFLIEELFLFVLQLPYFFLGFCDLLVDVAHAFPSFPRCRCLLDICPIKLAFQMPRTQIEHFIAGQEYKHRVPLNLTCSHP